MVRDDLIQSLLRNGDIEIAKSAITRIREMIKPKSPKTDFDRIQALDAVIVTESTLKDFLALGGSLDSFEDDLPQPVKHEDMFKAIAEYDPQYLVDGYIAMTPQGWLDFSTERTNEYADGYKQSIIRHTIDNARNNGYYYWASEVENSPVNKALSD